ncbi:MAG: hypothetical protein KDK70_28515 [Myxococcales bacterium]|nr:hypothetical protein [Myxococcales bacterium]
MTTCAKTGQSGRMVRLGALAFLILGLAACTQSVDDPANFTAGNTQGMTTMSTSSTSGADDTESATSAADGSASATTTGASADSTSGPPTTGPADTGPVGNCGNGIIDPGEQCDGSDLQGFDCSSLGLSGGTLACDGEMCTFDTSMCSSTTGGTSG